MGAGDLGICEMEIWGRNLQGPWVRMTNYTINQGVSNWLPPPLRSKSRENKGGQTSSNYSASDFGPQKGHFLKRFPLTSARNTPKFSACGGPNPASLKI